MKNNIKSLFTSVFKSLYHNKNSALNLKENNYSFIPDDRLSRLIPDQN